MGRVVVEADMGGVAAEMQAEAEGRLGLGGAHGRGGGDDGGAEGENGLSGQGRTGRGLHLAAPVRCCEGRKRGRFGPLGATGAGKVQMEVAGEA